MKDDSDSGSLPTNASQQTAGRIDPTLLRLVFLLAAIGLALHPSAVSAQGDLVLESAGIAPHGAGASQGPLVIRCNIRNDSDVAQEAIAVARVVGVLTSEDRLLVRVEPHRTQSFEMPVRIPDAMKDGKIEVDVSMVAMRDGNEVMLMNGSEPANRRATAWRNSRKQLVTALAMGPEPLPVIEWRWESDPIDSTMELALATRIDAELSNDCIVFESAPLPIHSSEWLGIDTLIIAEPRYLRDDATISILRSFMTRGGRIWIMLDDIDCSLVEPFLESHQSLQHLDTVELNRCTVTTETVSMSEEDRRAEFETAVPLKRVKQRGGEVIHSIDGWPASILMSVGRGELLLTTLHSRAWIQPRRTQSGNDPRFQSAYETQRWARSLIDFVHVPRAAPLIKLSDQSYPTDRIGNPVVSRAFVTSTLLAFCAALVGLGLWRLFVGEIPRVGLWYPAIAILAAAPILIAGILQKKDIPASASLLQWVQFDNPIGATLRESSAVYLPNPSAMELVSRREGFAVLDANVQSGIAAMTLDDLERWRLSNVAWPTGVWKYTTETSLPEKSMVAVGRFTADGLEVQIPPGLPSTLTDPILSYVAGAPVLGVAKDDTTLLVDGSFPAEGERWTLQSMVDEEQRRRSAIYRKSLDGGDRLRVQTRTLTGWTELFDAGPAWSEPLVRRGAALVAMPVVLETPPIGERILVPYSLMNVKSTSSGDASPIFMNSVGRWISQSSNASATLIEMSLPPQVVPMRADEVTLSWDVEAPRRTARLAWVHPKHGTATPIVSLEAPSVPWSATLQDPAILEAVGSGKLSLRVDISNDKEPGGSLPWRIRHLRMAVRGVPLAKYRWDAASVQPPPAP